MQKTNHTSTCVSDDTSTSARVNNDTSTSAHVSDNTRSLACVSNDTGGLACVRDDIGGPIRLWHVSAIKLRHISLTHPQTPINRSLPKTFEKKKDSELKKALQESNLKAFKNFNPEIEEHLKSKNISNWETLWSPIQFHKQKTPDLQLPKTRKDQEVQN